MYQLKRKSKFKDKKFQKFNLTIFLWIFIASYFIDGITKYIYVGGVQLHLSMYFRIFTEIYLLIFIVLFLDKKKLIYLTIIALFSLASLIVLIVMSEIQYDYPLLQSIIILNKYSYIFIIYIAISHFKNKIYLFENVYLKILILNSTFVFLGVIFDINLFSTYYKVDFLYGYNGLIPSQNESTIFFIIGFLFLYYKYKINQTKKNFFLLVYLLLSMLFVGTKGIFIYLLLFTLILIIVNKNYKIFFSITLLSLVSFFFLESLEFFKSYAYYVSKLESNSVLYVLLSGRNELLINALDHINNDWSILNWLFGGTNQIIYLIEMGFFDLFIFFGILGTMLYLYIFNKIFVSSINITLKNKILIFLPLMIIVFLSGHFFTSAVIAIYLVIFILYIKYHSKTLRRLK